MQITVQELRDVVLDRIRHAETPVVDYIRSRLITPEPWKLVLISERQIVGSRPEAAAARQALLDGYRVTHIADIGPIPGLESRPEHQLMVLSQEGAPLLRLLQVRHEVFRQLRGVERRSADVDVRYDLDMATLETVCAWLNGADAPDGAGRSFSAPAQYVDPRRLAPRFHDPAVLANSERIRTAGHVRLAEVADILWPVPQQEPGLLLGPSAFAYPLDADLVADGVQTDVVACTGDVLVSRIRPSAVYLLDEEPVVPLSVSPACFVIRLQDTRLSPEYLFAFLQSEQAQGYFHALRRGEAISHLERTVLLDLAVPLPSEEADFQARRLFQFAVTSSRIDEPGQLEFLLGDCERLIGTDASIIPVHERLLAIEAARAQRLAEERAAEQLIEFSRQDGRVCPRPSSWTQFWRRLGGSRDPDRTPDGPPSPLVLAEWGATSSAEKQARLEAQIRWAFANGRLSQASRFLRTLPLDQWERSDDR